MVLLLLSGCSGAKAGPADASLTTAPQPIVSESTGSITGTIVDDEQQPLAGAEVAANGPGQGAAKSDAEGRFTINELQPGSYVVSALKLGYEQVAKRVEVAAGEAVPLTLVLASVFVPSGDPRIDYRIHDGYLQGPNVYCFCVIVYHTQSFVLNFTAGAQEIVASMEWQANAPTTARYLRLGLAWPDTGTAKQSNATYGKSPLTTKIGEIEVEDKGKARMYWHLYFACPTLTVPCLTSNPDVLVPVIMYEQRVKLYSSVFYNQVAPEGYTGLPGA